MNHIRNPKRSLVQRPTWPAGESVRTLPCHRLLPYKSIKFPLFPHKPHFLAGPFSITFARRNLCLVATLV